MKEPLYRRTYDASTLPRDHPPRFRHPHKAMLFDIAHAAAQLRAATSR